MAQHWILARAESLADSIAMIWNEQQVSYGQLQRLIEEALAELRTRGVAAGDSVALIGDYSPHAAALLLAMIINRNVAVPLTRRVSGARRERFLSVAEVDTLIELDESDDWTLTHRQSVREASLLRALRERGEPGLVIFSSGSTGEHKAILHSFDRILERFRPQRPPLRSLVFLMLDQIGGINTLLGLLTSGGTAVSVSTRTPEAICQAIQQWKVQLLPTSPTFLNMLLMSDAHRRYDLSSLQLITYGTEPMPPATLQRIVEEFPNVKLRQLYGLSELGILPTHSPSSSSLQMKLGGEGVETKLHNGTLWVKTRAAMLGYLNLPSPFDADGWMDTGDLVESDGEWLRVLGRKSELINVGGEKVTPAEVENTILQMDNVHDVTVRGRPNAVMGNVVTAQVVLRHPEDPEQLKRRIQEYCSTRMPRYKVPMFVEVREPQELDRFKKIRREV